MDSSPITIEGVKIMIDSEQSIDNFGDDTFEDLVIDFIEETYDSKKSEVELGLEKEDLNKIKHATHTLKTTSRYVFEIGFADACQKMEYWSSKFLNLEKLKENSENYFKYLDLFYLELLVFYKDIKTQRGEKLLDEFVLKVKDPNEYSQIKNDKVKPEEIKVSVMDDFFMEEIKEQSVRDEEDYKPKTFGSFFEQVHENITSDNLKKKIEEEKIAKNIKGMRIDSVSSESDDEDLDSSFEKSNEEKQKQKMSRKNSLIKLNNNNELLIKLNDNCNLGSHERIRGLSTNNKLKGKPSKMMDKLSGVYKRKSKSKSKLSIIETKEAIKNEELKKNIKSNLILYNYYKFYKFHKFLIKFKSQINRYLKF